MPRKPREFSSTNIYHIILRGNDKSDIFYDTQDRYVFLNIIKETKEKFNCEVYSYCLMSNHIHMIIKVKSNFLSKAIQSLGIKYSAYFNKKFNRRGHLFENRFFSKKVENLNYFLTVCKYVHRNPEKANIERTEVYRWSSYKEYIGTEKIIDSKVLLHYFKDDIEEFKRYTLKNDDKEQLYNFSEFELIKRLSEEEVSNIIVQKFNLKRPSDVSILEKERKDEILINLKELQGSSLAQVSRITKVTEYYIRKIWYK